MKRLISLLLIAAMLLGSIVPAFAEESGVHINMNPIQTTYTPQEKIIIAGTVSKDGVQQNANVLISIEEKGTGRTLWVVNVDADQQKGFIHPYALSRDMKPQTIVIKVQPLQSP